MRRTYLTLAIAALATATLGPIQAFGGDREIAEQIISKLKTNRDSGALKDFTLDMKVDQGVVLLRGNVSADEMKSLVLSAADGIEGVSEIIDEVTVDGAVANEVATEHVAATPPSPAAVESDSSSVAKQNRGNRDGFSFKEALAAEAKLVRETTRQPLTVMPGIVKPTSALEESTSDQDVISSVVGALGRAKNDGRLKGFGVDVKCYDGVVQLTGRAASEAQRNAIVNIARGANGVSDVRESIAVPAPAPTLPSRAQAQVPARLASAPVKQIAAPMMNPSPIQAAPVQSAPASMPAMTAPYRMQQSPMQAMPASAPMGGGVMGQPVPMAPYAAAGTPRYDSPNLPNYAWPGYAAHPNYAALSYPQQYSPSAWPYIGPFYPYPQVPLGWRKVSLEWDDGWWFLDFTDR